MSYIRTENIAGSFSGGVLTIAAAATPQQITATSTKCQWVWVGAPVDADGVASNTKPVFIGESSDQSKVGTGPLPILPSNFEGFIIQIDDVSKLWVSAGVNGNKLHYRYFV